MRKCKKCESPIPTTLFINGKRRYLHGRKFCIDCSPFGANNRRDLTVSKSQKKREAAKKWQKTRQNKIYTITGKSCWICGYDLDTRVLDFHHLDPKSKKFNVNARTMSNFAWLAVFIEIKKCALLCCRCHREVEYNVTQVNINDIHRSRWQQILREVCANCGLEHAPEKCKPVKLSKIHNCQECGKTISKNGLYCKSCAAKKFNKRKVPNRPKLDDLNNEIMLLGYCGAARKYGVSDNCLRKWIKR